MQVDQEGTGLGLGTTISINKRDHRAQGASKGRNSLELRPSFFLQSGRFGAPGRTRTCDPLLRRQMLYPLSYGSFDLDRAAYYHGPETSPICGKEKRLSE